MLKNESACMSSAAGKLPAGYVQTVLERAMADTRRTPSLQLNLALSYGGRDEITRAAAGAGRRGAGGPPASGGHYRRGCWPRAWTPRGIPDPDLLIRTGGDMRVSNFLLWQLAYTEIFVTPTLWPDFTRESVPADSERFQEPGAAVRTRLNRGRPMRRTFMTAAAKGQAHLKRWITGLAALPVLIVCVVAGGAAFSLLVGLGCFVCLWEYFRIVGPPGTRGLTSRWLWPVTPPASALILAAHAGRAEIILRRVGLNGVVCGLLSLRRFPSDRSVLELSPGRFRGSATSRSPGAADPAALRPGRHDLDFSVVRDHLCGRHRGALCRHPLGPSQTQPSHQPGKDRRGIAGRVWRPI